MEAAALAPCSSAPCSPTSSVYPSPRPRGRPRLRIRLGHVALPDGMLRGLTKLCAGPRPTTDASSSRPPIDQRRGTRSVWLSEAHGCLRQQRPAAAARVFHSKRRGPRSASAVSSADAACRVRVLLPPPAPTPTPISHRVRPPVTCSRAENNCARLRPVAGDPRRGYGNPSLGSLTSACHSPREPGSPWPVLDCVAPVDVVAELRPTAGTWTSSGRRRWRRPTPAFLASRARRARFACQRRKRWSTMRCRAGATRAARRAQHGADRRHPALAPSLRDAASPALPSDCRG